jgi:hypothetical protein
MTAELAKALATGQADMAAVLKKLENAPPGFNPSDITEMTFDVDGKPVSIPLNPEKKLDI